MVWKSLSARRRQQATPVVSHPCPDHGRTYGFDQVLFVKGFGAVASGWQLVGRGRVQNMSLTAGTRTLELDRRCLVTVSRQDLQGMAPQPEMIWTAGFRAILRGSPVETLTTEPVLTLSLEGGLSSKLPIPMGVIRQSEGPEAIAAIIDLFPSFANEPFLPAFVDAVATTVKARAADVLMVGATKTRNVVVMVLPTHWDDLFLMMSAVFRFQALLPADVGLALMMSPEHPRVRVLDRFGDLGFRSGRPMSLFEVTNPTYALWSLTPALKQIGAERFVFCGPDTVLTRSGWEAAASFFASKRTGPELFLPGETGEGVSTVPESLGFAWTTDAFVRWAATAPFFFSGFHRDNHLPTDAGSGSQTAAVSLLHSAMPSEAIRRADERLYQAASVAKPRQPVPALPEPRSASAGAVKPPVPAPLPPRLIEKGRRPAGSSRTSDVAVEGGAGAPERSRVS